uniref:G_PROTEIN_RECEP_F1_2 domain-containing protein n=1 Tax=Mesocestoides corti TaxID=53468 RepID=A0A5K3EM59_MESCO
MGRVGSRSKTSSTGVSFEAEAAFVPIDFNSSILEILLSGHFEADFFSYCSNRLTDYTCHYWFDSRQSEHGRAVPLSFSSQIQNLASSFSTSNDTGFSPINNPVETHSQMLLRFADSSKLPVSITGGIGPHGLPRKPNETAVLITDLVQFSLTNKQHASLIILSFILLFSLMLNLLSIHCLHQISSCGIKITRVLVYLVVLETADLFFELINTLVYVSQEVPLFTIMEFFGRWSCQTLSMGYSCLKHAEGLLIATLALDSVIFLKSLRQHVAQFRAEWAYNIFILIIAFLGTTNSQYFWTFDLFHLDNRIHLSDSGRGGGANNEPSLYACGFSPSWGLSHVFTSHIWPIVDHLLADVFPCILPLVAGTLILARHRDWLRLDNRDIHTTCATALDETLCILPVLFILHGISTLPRMVFYIAKYFVFSEKNLNRIGLIFHREDNQLPGDGKIVTAIAKLISFRQISPKILPQLKDIDFSLRFILPIFTLGKALVVVFGFSASRRMLRGAFKRILTFSCFQRCSQRTRVRSDPIKAVANNSERIAFTDLLTTGVPRVVPSKTPLYISREDVEEFAV